MRCGCDDLVLNHTDAELLRRHPCGSIKKVNKNVGQVLR